MGYSDSDITAMYANTGQLIYAFLVNDKYSLPQIAREFGVATSTIYEWVDRADIGGWYDMAMDRLAEQRHDEGVVAVDDYFRERGCV